MSEANAHQVNAFFLGALVDDADERAGADEVDAALRRAGIDRATTSDRNAWVSLRECEAAVRELVLITDPLLVRRAGRAALGWKWMGPLRTFIRAFATPTTAYHQMVAVIPRFNKAGTFEIEQTGQGRVVLTYETADGAEREVEPLVCSGREANLAAVPTLFDLPEATVEHPECLHRGSDRCVYEVTFVQPGARWRSRSALVLGGAAGTILGASFSLGIASVLLMGVAAAFLAWGQVRQWELRADLERSASMLNEQQDALRASAMAHESRFAELVAAKAAVDAKVEERTRDLAETSARLVETLDEVRALARSRTDFFANISHELRTPLTLLLSPLDHLAMGKDPPGGRDATFSAMKRNAQRLLTMINQLLDLSRAEATEAKLERVAVEPGVFVQSVASAFESAAKIKGVSLEVSCVGAEQAISLDAKWLETALTNLLANALRYSECGDTIRLSTHDTGAHIIFEVADEGPGITEDQQKNMFERFARGENAKAGTGLGLALVSQAARLHGGSASVQSKLGQGATFRLEIPRVVTSTSASAPSIREHALERVEPSRVERRDGPNLTAPLAFVVEDNPDVRRFVCDVLAARYRVESATNGVEALARLETLRPDVIVSDVSMPKMDGLELTRAIRLQAKANDVPIILVTARGEHDHVLAGFDAGADDYVVKPFHGRELLARADTLVKNRRLAGKFAHRERLATVGLTAASVAHHVRNPLNAILAGLPVVRRKLGDGLDERTSRMFEVFIESANRIEAVTQDLLDLARADQGLGERYAPGRSLAACIRIMETRFGDGIDLRTRVDEETLVVGRSGDMCNVFLNLLDNASRAVDGSGVVEVVAKRDGDDFEIRVADGGPGVPPEIAERIFEPFVTTRTAGDGTGLGLSIARDVVTQHGGTIALCQSTLGGAEFRIRIPLAC